MSDCRIYADFQKLDDFNRLKLTCAGTYSDLERTGIRLEEGLALTFYTDDGDDDGRPDDLLVDGIVHYDPDEEYWTAEVDWNSLRHVSEETEKAKPKVPKLPANR